MWFFQPKQSQFFTRESYFEKYIQGKSFQKRRNHHKKNFPRSYYCYICDCRRNLNWHHIDYTKLFKEDFFRDGWWLCDPRCPCGRNCHFSAHKAPDGTRLALKRPILEERRKQLRSKYLKAYIKPTTFTQYLLISLYRFFY